MAEVVVTAAVVGGASQQTTVVVNETGPTVEVRPGESINSAVDALPGGGRVLLRGGDYPSWSRSNDTARASFVSVESYPGEQPVLAGISLANVARLRLRGLRCTGVLDLYNGTRLLEVYDHVQEGKRISLSKSGQSASCSDLLFDGIVTKNMLWSSADGSSGYGFRHSTSRLDRLTVRNWLADNCQVDGLQLGATFADVLIEDFTVRNVRPAPGSGSHADALQFVAAGTNLTIRRGTTIDCAHPIRIAPSQAGATVHNILLEDLLICRIDNVPFQISSAVQSGEVRHCTVVDCDLEPSMSAGDQVAVHHCIFDSPYGGQGLNSDNWTRADGAPGFVDKQADDYRLLVGAPAAGKGRRF
jgi:hypothetical protein